ncbi:hypothetical protein H3C61_03890 [Candidatus Gracilibacteria bacterium]|nr:hypothetical protein [Candidatus Gracilibacteria bacterium]
MKKFFFLIIFCFCVNSYASGDFGIIFTQSLNDSINTETKIKKEDKKNDIQKTNFEILFLYIKNTLLKDIF